MGLRSTEVTVCCLTSLGCYSHVKSFSPCCPFRGLHPFVEMQWATAFCILPVHIPMETHLPAEIMYVILK